MQINSCNICIKWRSIALIAFLALASGCGDSTKSGPSPPPEGTLVDAEGNSVSLDDFLGRYVWLDYAAEWCAACTPQTMAIKSVAATKPRQLVFVTIMTTEREGYGHPSTQATAARWAARFDLDPARVWAGKVNARFLPRNILLSPQGEVLFDEVGELSTEQIRAELARHLKD